jgi:hypothetical protein
VQVPVLLVIVNVAPIRAGALARERDGFPGAAAGSCNREARREDGARRRRVVTLIAWIAFCACTVSLTCVAAVVRVACLVEQNAGTGAARHRTPRS